MLIYPVTTQEAQTIRWISFIAPLLATVIILFLTAASLAG